MSVRIHVFAICALLSFWTLDATSQEKISQAPSAQDDSLKQAIKNYAQKDNDPDENHAIRYVAAFRDLNDDGKLEAIVYLIDPDYCGSGGCNTLILANKNGAWKVVSSISITRPPIRVLPKTSHGWQSLGVLVAGGGILDGYEAELDFNGKSYPRNPTVPPAKQLREPQGEILIQSEKDAKSLY